MLAYSIKSVIDSMDRKDIRRIMNTGKEFVSLMVVVTNAFCKVWVRCTNSVRKTYKEESILYTEYIQGIIQEMKAKGELTEY